MYNAQHYNKAIEAFEELINSGIEDPVVYYNLGIAISKYKIS